MRLVSYLLGITYKDRTSNEKVKRQIHNEIGPSTELITIVRKRKLMWYDHVTRSSGLAKTILQGTVPGGRRRGRERWENNIAEWTNLKMHETIRVAQNREERIRVVTRPDGSRI